MEQKTLKRGEIWSAVKCLARGLVLYIGDSLWRPYVPFRKDRVMMMMAVKIMMMMVMMGVVEMLRKEKGKDRSEEKTRKKM